MKKLLLGFVLLARLNSFGADDQTNPDTLHSTNEPPTDPYERTQPLEEPTETAPGPSEIASAKPPFAGSPGRWTSFARGGSVYQPDTDLDAGESYTATRLTLQLGSGYSQGRQDGASLSLGYSYDGYTFSEKSTAPWEDIHTLSLSAPFRKKLNDDWSGFLIPTIRSTGENNAKFDDTITGGIISGASRRLSDTLSIGPGIGYFAQLEDSATIIPILIIDWQLSEQLNLSTGRGLGATMGPGLTLTFSPSDIWSLGIGGRYEKLRFRLDENGTVANGIGEDTSIPLYLTSTHTLNRKTTLNMVGGFEFGGELKLEDEDGNSISTASYDTGLFFGVTFSQRF